MNNVKLKMDNCLLGDLCQIRPSRKPIGSKESVTFIGMEDVSGDGKIINHNLLPFSEIKNGLTYFEKNDVLVAKITPCFENGKGACLDNLKTEKGFGSTEFHILRTNNNSVPRYIFYHTQSEKFRRKLESEMVGSAGQKRVSASAILNYPLSIVHSKAEQTAIATALSDADALISSLEKLIAKKRNIKQGAMQQLLTGKKCLPGFSGKWEVMELGEIFTFLNTANNSREDLMESGEIGYIHYGDIHTKWSNFLDCSKNYIPYIKREKVKDIPFLENGDLVVADASEDYEGIGVCVEIKNIGERNVVAGLHTLLLRGNKSIVADGFKGYLREIEGVKDALIRIATGISVYGISKNNLKNVKVKIPPIKEQTAIAQVLSDMDAEIEALEKKMEKYKMIKQGMMQELLTGKTRLV